jgi:hypothetical protein
MHHFEDRIGAVFKITLFFNRHSGDDPASSPLSVE